MQIASQIKVSIWTYYNLKLSMYLLNGIEGKWPVFVEAYIRHVLQIVTYPSIAH